MKKLLIISVCMIFMSCSSALSPIPTASNDGGILGTTQDILRGRWGKVKNRFSKDSNSKTQSTQNNENIESKK